MSTPTHGYLHADTPFGIELERLRLLEIRYDDVTRGRLGGFGPLRGARCLEVGAGAGSVARMLSAMVGTEGEVVATDVDPRFLVDLEPVPGGGSIEVRRHDIVCEELPDGGFDLVHCRALLLHLPDPARALGRLAAALRPGGWLLVEDADYTPFGAAEPEHPVAARFDEGIRAILTGIGENQMDMDFGRRLPALMDGFGLAQRGGEALQFRRRGGGPEAEMFRHGFEHLRDELLEVCGLSAVDFDEVVAAFADPTFEFFDSLNVAAWGRRPESGFLG